MEKKKKILIIGIQNKLSEELLKKIKDDPTLEIYGLDLIFSFKHFKKYKKVFYPKSSKIDSLFEEALTIKYDLIYYFDYFSQDIFLLDYENTMILYKKIRSFLNKVWSKKIIFITNTNPLNFLKHYKEYSQDDFEFRKNELTFRIENLIKRAFPQVWTILRFHNLYSAEYYNKILHQLLYRSAELRVSKNKAETLFLPYDNLKTSFIHIDDAIKYLEKTDYLTGEYIISSKQIVNSRDLYQLMFIYFKIKPRYIIHKEYKYNPFFVLNSSKEIEDLGIFESKNFFMEIYNIYKYIINKKKKDSYLIDFVYKDINFK